VGSNDLARWLWDRPGVCVFVSDAPFILNGAVMRGLFFASLQSDLARAVNSSIYAILSR
jgi:hypothetical protein